MAFFSAASFPKSRRMSKSGFYRYCLAKEVGYGETEALRVAEHAGAGSFAVVDAPTKNINYRDSAQPAKRKKARP